MVLTSSETDQYSSAQKEISKLLLKYMARYSVGQYIFVRIEPRSNCIGRLPSNTATE